MEKETPTAFHWAVAIYVWVGLAIGIIKLASYFTWLLFHIFVSEPQLEGHQLSSRGTLVAGVGGPFLTGLTWPIATYQVITGSASLGETLFFPWVLPEHCNALICRPKDR